MGQQTELDLKFTNSKISFVNLARVQRRKDWLKIVNSKKKRLNFRNKNN